MQGTCCYFICVISFSKNYWECALHVRRHHRDVKCPISQERRKHGSWWERLQFTSRLCLPLATWPWATASSLWIGASSYVTTQYRVDCIDRARENTCKRTLETRNTMKCFSIWSVLFRSFVCVLSGVGLVLGAGVWWMGHMGKDHTEPRCLQGHKMTPFSVFNCIWAFWPYLPQILLSHSRVTCLPRRCQRSVTCYTALVSVNCTSQVRQGWQDYYNIWCDVAFYYHHLTLSSFSKLLEQERCYMVHMTGRYFKLLFLILESFIQGLVVLGPPTTYQKLEFVFVWDFSPIWRQELHLFVFNRYSINVE